MNSKLLIILSVIAFCGAQTRAACDPSWKIGTMSGYDNLDGLDDRHPGSLAEYTGTTENFLNNVGVVSILKSDWNRNKYRNIEIQYKGKTRTVQSWDMCSDADCGDDDPNCCTRNARKFANPGFLLDVERRALKRLFGLSYEETLVKVQYRLCDKFDPAPIARRYGLRRS